ncbi:MAG: GAF domain-containing protein [Chloroflexi bacterium]|nr:GAF domain-containing protein [Chloroflexota bacterium]
MQRPAPFHEFITRATQVLVLAYQLVALGAFVATLILASDWLRQPFPGAFFEHTMAYNGAVPSQPGGNWDLVSQGISLGDQLLSIDGEQVHTARDVAAALEGFAPGDTLPVEALSTGGGTQTYTVLLQAFPAADRNAYLVIPAIISLVFLGTSLWIFGMRRSEPAGQAFAIFTSSLAIITGALFEIFTTHYLTHLWTLALGLLGGAGISLAAVFPQEIRLVKRYPYLRWVSYLAGLGLAGYAFTTLFAFDRPTAYIEAWQLLYLFVGFAGLFFMGMMVYRLAAAPSPIVKAQARAILIGGALAFTPMTGWLLLKPFGLFDFHPALFLPVALFPLATGFTILRYRQARTDLVIRRGLLFTLLAVLVAAAYTLILLGLSLLLGQAIAPTNPWLVGGLALLLALLLQPLRDRLQNLVNAIFFRGERAYQKRIQDFSLELTTTVDFNGVMNSLRRHITETLIPEQAHLYIYDPLNDQYNAVPGADSRPTSDLRFSPASALVKSLAREQLPLFIDPAGSLPAALQPEQARLALLGASLFVPLPGRERLVGWMALSPRRSGESYGSQDISFLEQLGNQAAVAIERAQVVSSMERRVREMNILARVAQGVNITVAYDDILELIYAQTDQILPVDDFHITLHSKENDFLYFAFCLEQDDRLLQKENLPLPSKLGLSSLVIHNRRALLTADYTRECRERGLTPATSGTFAWVGVPLNAGAETIGSLSIASRDASVGYTPGQVELLQAIADQAAGAIVKARLLQETERRARQLSTLNEITRQLTSTLEPEPLLQTILESAVVILNCEAGSLFLVDDQTDELVFRVATGGAASDLVGQRLPPGSGIVGKAVQTRAPVIENDAQRSNAWYNTDQQTGFETRSLLAVPMQVKERVIGVLEVINRLDRLPFVEDDQNLLTAFASQAAVAIENARLYTLTDQELSERVAELSVMQRIDRELNASLDVARAMRITLDWAMRQSAAEAGLIGIVGEKGLQVMAEQGYADLLAAYRELPLPLGEGAARAAVEGGQPQQAALDEYRPGLLPQALRQVVVPIRRETRAIGLILLESLSPAEQTETALTFLSRLSDHAAIAIANAQLYGEVQAANLAKSEFVSFVAHELKNPMTSIKGYTELLSAGAVGQVNEMQGNFLGTIRSNVERMSTLVSDLNDNSKIEAGRLRLDFKAVDLKDAIEEVMRSSNRQFEDKKQTVSIQLPPELPKVWADPTRLGQIMTNLVNNAHKYTPEGGQITIGAERHANQWDQAGAPEVVHLWVKDNGIGISLEDQKKIFQKFFRSEDQKAREAPGTGLGLNITRSLIEMQGGQVWFESEFRQGTAFHFTVPVAEV